MSVHTTAPPARELSVTGRLLRNSAALSATQIVRFGVNALLYIFVARLLGVGDLGKLAIIVSYWNIFQVVATVGAPRLLIRTIAREPEAAGVWFRRGLTAQMVGALVAGLALIALSNTLRHAADTEAALYVVALALLPAAAVSTLESVYQGREQMHWITKAQAVGAALQLALGIALLLNGWGIMALAWALVAGQLCTAALEAFWARGYRLWQDMRFEPVEAWNLARGSVYFYAHALSQAVFARLDVLVLSQVVGEAATGIYSAAFLVITVVNFVSVSYGNAIYPLLSNLFAAQRERFETLLRRSLLFSTAATMLAMIWLVTLAEPIITLLYGIDYAAAILLLRLVAPMVVVFAWNSLLASALLAANEQRSSVVVAGVKLALAFIYYLAGTYWLGAVGAALATVLSGLTGTLLNLILLQARSGLRRPQRDALRPAAAGVATLALIWLLVGQPWPVLWAAATLVYALLLAALRTFDAATWRTLRHATGVGRA